MAAPDETVSVRQGYARWSETYDGQDTALVILEEPLVRSVLGDVQGLRVVDTSAVARNAIRRYLAEADAQVTVGRLLERNDGSRHGEDCRP